MVVKLESPPTPGQVALNTDSSSTDKFNHPTMPLYPPNETSASLSTHSVKSRGLHIPSDRPAFPQPEILEPMSYIQGDRQSSSSRKSKRGTSRHRQFLAELLQFYPHLSSAAEPDGDVNGVSDDPSPTDSHAHRPSHSRSRSQPSRHSSNSISGILIMTTERLHTETARANAAEKQVAEVMSLFKNTHEQKLKLERDLAHVREELGWYKIQLDVAQKEIFRAQETVERVDRQRVEAEEAAAKARERSRKLVEARAVELAMEEGRRLGFEEGLKHGRVLSQMSETHDASYSSSRRRSASRYKRRRNSNLSKGGSSESLQSDGSSVSSSKQTQRRHPRSSSSSKPEEIAIQDNNANVSIRPVPNKSPAASRRSIPLPDNFIPTLNADSTITLPPPHELSIPVLREVPLGPSSAPLGASSHHHGQERDKYTETTKEASSSNKRYTRPAFPESPTPRREPLDSNRIVPKPPPELAEPRSPSTYPNRPPRKQREIVMPVPLGGQFLHGGPTLNSRYGTTSNPFASSSSQTSPPTGSRTRTTSSTTIPGIKVETPSTVSAKSEKTIVDPILLTPDHANRPVQLPPHPKEQQPTDGGLGLYADPTTGQQTLNAVLLDNNLPPGFVPLSPIPGMANLNPYPPPSLSKDQARPVAEPGFVYPSSPLRRPE